MPDKTNIYWYGSGGEAEMETLSGEAVGIQFDLFLVMMMSDMCGSQSQSSPCASLIQTFPHCVPASFTPFRTLWFGDRRYLLLLLNIDFYVCCACVATPCIVCVVETSMPVPCDPLTLCIQAFRWACPLYMPSPGDGQLWQHSGGGLGNNLGGRRWTVVASPDLLHRHWQENYLPFLPCLSFFFCSLHSPQNFLRYQPYSCVCLERYVCNSNNMWEWWKFMCQGDSLCVYCDDMCARQPLLLNCCMCVCFVWGCVYSPVTE